MLRALADAGYETTENVILKEAAARLGLDPYAFYDVFKKTAATN
jgi:hypothetical protein